MERLTESVRSGKTRNPVPLTLAAVLLAAFGLVACHSLASTPPPEQLHSTIDEILSSPGYQVNPPLSWVVERWLLKQLRRLLDLMAGLSQTGPLAGLPQWAWWLIVGLSVVLLALIVAHLVMSIRGLIAEPRRREGVGGDGGLAARSPEQILREAEAAAGRGELRPALRLLYEAMLLQLDRLDILRYDPARTNWENLRAATRRQPGLRGAMTPLTTTVDACLYGPAAATEDVFAECRELVRRIWHGEVAGGE
ncbi:MAG: DUF4129 domain-containing protein [Armatimonadetes bacterium]|nr:DUF4129 domain-containing protein [Armatimonadota bacterium]